MFAALVKAYKDKAWKSYRHEDGEYCFGGGWFIVGIDTPEGSYTYHYENKYWDMFDCIDLPRAKHWDGHTESDAETRLMSLPERKTYGDTISRQAAIDILDAYQVMVENGEENPYAWARLRMSELPPTQPKIGHWIENEKQNHVEKMYHCSECGFNAWGRYEKTKFCGGCGVRMENAYEGSD